MLGLSYWAGCQISCATKGIQVYKTGSEIGYKKGFEIGSKIRTEGSEIMYKIGSEIGRKIGYESRV